MPKRAAICEHWEDKIEDLDGNCFACGSSLRVERAHIVPLCEGGTNDVSNLHLLCATCHIDSEPLPVDLYWAWLWRMRETHPFTHAVGRYERIYGPDWKSILAKQLGLKEGAA